MDKQVVWNKIARIKFDNIVTYLKNEWSEKTAENFVKITFQYLFLLSKFPNIGRKSGKKPSIRLINITRHNQLFYRIAGNKIIILTLIDLRQDSTKKQY